MKRNIQSKFFLFSFRFFVVGDFLFNSNLLLHRSNYNTTDESLKHSPENNNSDEFSHNKIRDEIAFNNSYTNELKTGTKQKTQNIEKLKDTEDVLVDVNELLKKQLNFNNEADLREHIAEIQVGYCLKK